MSRRVLSVLTALLVTGCGTTVATPAAQLAPSSLQPSAEANAPSGGTAGGALGAVSDAPSTIRPEVSTSQVTTTGTSGRARLGASHGVAGASVKVGVLYTKFTGSTFGLAAIDSGDQRAFAQASIDDINRRGGVLGRKLVPVYYEYDFSPSDSAADRELKFSAACSHFTQDSPVFLAIGVLTTDNYRACLSKAGVVLLNEGFTTIGQSGYAKFPSYVEINGLDLDRGARALVTALVEQNWFTSWDASLGRPGTGAAKVGVVSLDSPYFRHAVDRVLNPGLARAGHRVVSTAYLPMNDLSAAGSAAQGVMLQFRRSGITHVLIYDWSANLTVVWMPSARSQRYFPRYGGNSQNGWETLAGTGTFDRAQLAGAAGMGWSPMLDLREQDNPDDGKYSSPARRACVALQKRAGITYSGQNAKVFGLQFCDLLLFFRHVATSAGPAALTNAGFLQAVAKAGSSFASAAAPRIAFPDSRRDGLAGYYQLAYDASCSCMRYSGNMKLL